jgi:hypothetical protein
LLLVLCRRDDATAAAIAEHARGRGLAVVRCEPSHISLTVESERDGGHSVEFHRGGAKLDVTAVLNRTHGVGNGAEESRFRAAETLGAWWAALAEFPGPVVNRPSVHGFQPEPDVDDLALRAGLPCAARTLATSAPTSGARNVHRLVDGSHVGFFGDGMADPRETREVRRYTRFHPARAAYALVAGESVTAVGEGPKVAPDALSRLGAAASEQGIRFAFLVLQVADPPALVHVSAFPVLGNYRGYEEPVHRGLVDFLAGR